MGEMNSSDFFIKIYIGAANINKSSSKQPGIK